MVKGLCLLIITHICGPFLKCLYVLNLEFLFGGTVGPDHVPVGQWPCVQSEIHEDMVVQCWNGRTQVGCTDPTPTEHF